MNIRLIIPSLVLLACAASGTAYALTSSGDSHRLSKVIPTSYSRIHQSRGLSSNPVSFAEAVQQAYANMPGSSVQSITVGQPPAGPPATQRAGMPWIYAKVSIPAATGAGWTEPLWQADLIEGAAVERAGVNADAYNDLGGATFDGVLPDGTVVSNIGGGIGDVARGQVFSTASDESIRTAITSAAQSLGLTVVSVTIFHALDPAPAVVVRSSDLAADGPKVQSIINTLFGQPPTYEGFYFELESPSGADVYETSAAYRTGGGHEWVDPAYRSEIASTSM